MMNKHTSKITTKSIEQSGLPNDYRKALAEFIWNGFDALATEIHLDFDENELGHLSSLSINDNGTGIDIRTIDETFGNFLDSNKRDHLKRGTFQKGRKGKGRYSFSVFANSCHWVTTFVGPEEKMLRYTIIINKGDLQNFVIEDTVIADGATTGTIVSFFNIFDLSSKSLTTKDFKDYLSSEFGWFLFLNKERGCNIIINGERLAYDEIIGDSEEQVVEIGDNRFEIFFIRWNQKIGDKYYFYFLSREHKEAGKKHTSFNNKAIDFHHSVYVKSEFFDDFYETTDENPVFDFSGKNQSHPSFKALLKLLNTLVLEKEKHYIRNVQADRLIHDFHTRALFPEPAVKTDNLEAVIKEVYCAEPRVFQSTNSQQSKTLLGLINILLATGQTDYLIDLIKTVVELTEEERERISVVL